MTHKKKGNWNQEYYDTGKTFVDEDLEEQESVEKNRNKGEAEGNIESSEEKMNEYLEMAQRIQAEFDNYRRRNLDIVQKSKQEGIVQAVTELLPILDTINSAKRQIVDENMAKSIELIYKQTLDCFANLGVKKIEAVGKPFDPNIHNAIMAEEVKGVEPDMVLDEFQEGFEINGKVIRHSVVKVSK